MSWEVGNRIYTRKDMFGSVTYYIGTVLKVNKTHIITSRKTRLNLFGDEKAHSRYEIPSRWKLWTPEVENEARSGGHRIYDLDLDRVV